MITPTVAKKALPHFVAMVLALVAPQAMAQTYVWDGSTTAGYQNINGTWGTDNFWTTNSGANSGTVLGGWTNTNGAAWFGGNSTTAASPATNITIAVSGTQTATGGLRQIANGAGNFTLEGGELQAGSIRVDTNTMTVNSALLSVTNARLDFSVQPAVGALLVLGGNNTFTNNVGIAGASGGGGTIRLTHQNALGLGNSVTWVHNTVLDLNGYSISGKNITVNDGRTAQLVNSGASNAVWSDNVLLTNTAAANFRAGGTNGEVEISGVISGGSGNQVQSYDGGRLRLSGVNTYDGVTSVRDNSTLIVGNASALGSTTSGTFINTGSSLDLNGFNVGNEAITLQQATSRLVNSNTTTAATIGGGVTLGATSSGTGGIGGNGDLTIASVVSGAFGFSKIGAGTLTLSASNTYSGTTTISAGSLRINDANALGQSTNVQYTATSGLDLNGFSVSGKTISIPGGATGFLTNSTASQSTWSGNVQLSATNAFLRAGGTNAEVEVSGAISGTGGLQSFDFGTLRVSGDNNYSGTTSVRESSTLIVGHSNALGSLSHTNFIGLNATLNLNGFDIGNRIIQFQNNNARLINDNTTNSAAVGGAITMLTNRTGARMGGAGNLTLNGNISTQDGTAGGFTKVGSGTLTLAGTTFYGGNTVVESGQLVLATNGSLRFVIGGSGTNNAVLGSGNAVMNGQFAFDLASASTNTNATWTIVTNTVVETYGATFTVTGFSGNTASGLWTNTTNGVDYVFSQSSGVLTVQPASSVAPYNAWVAFWQTNSAGFTNTAGNADPDGDGFINDVEFAFDGNPTVGTPALMTVTPVGTNALFSWIERTNGVIYEVQKNNTLTNAWTAAGFSGVVSTNQEGVLLSPTYVRKEFTTNATGKDFYRVKATIQP